VLVWVFFGGAELESGHMLHSQSFNLGDSMSALEMMDPKMDAAVLTGHVKPAGEVCVSVHELKNKRGI
jgi:hypothetical protein